MAATDVKVRLSIEGAQQVGTEVDRVVGSVDRLSGALGRVAALGAAGAGIVAATASVREMAAAIFEASAGAQRLRTQLDFATNGNSVRELSFVADMANRLGLEINSTAKAYAGFAAAARGTALEGEKARQIFEAVSKASAVMGLSADESRGALLALQQMVSKGVVSAEEFRQQLGERMPIALGAGARALGVTTAEFSKLLETGQIIASDFLPKFAAQIEKDLGGAAEKAAARLDASVNRLANSWTALKQQTGDAGASEFMASQMAVLADALNDTTSSMERAKQEGGGFTMQMLAAGGAALRFLNPVNAVAYQAQDVGEKIKRAEAELAGLREQLQQNIGNIVIAGAIKDTERLIAQLKLAQEEMAVLSGKKVDGSDARFYRGQDSSFDTVEGARFARRQAQAKEQGAVFAKYATDAQRLRTELDQVRAAFGGVIPPDLERQIREKFIHPTRDAIKEGRELAQELNLKSAGFDPKFIENMKDLQAYAKASGMATDGLQAAIARLIAQQPFAEAAIKKTTAAIVAGIEARAELTRAVVETNEWEDQRTRAMEASEQALADRVSAVRADIDASTLAVAANISMAEAIERVTLARMIEGRAALVNDPEKLASLDRQIEKQRQLVGLIAGADGKARLDAFLSTDKVQSFGTAFSDAFGRAGGAVTGLMQTLEAYGAQQQELARLSALAAKDGPEAQAKFAAKAAQAQISSYASMAGAAKGFFKEGTKGYKTLEAAEKTFRAFELALAIKTTAEKLGLIGAVTTAKVTGDAAQTASAVASVAPEVAASMAKGQAAAVAGVANQAGGDPYTAFFRIAAMAALMAGLGFAVSGGGSGVTTAAQRQEDNGTGTVLGDSKAKSESMLKALEQLRDTSEIGLSYQSGMLAALRSIDAAMSGVSTQILRAGGITTGQGLGIVEGKTPYSDTIGRGIATVGATLIGGPMLGALTSTVLKAVDKVLGPLWGSTKQSITDAGLSINGTVGGLAGGQGVQQYADVSTTTKSWFGLVKKTSSDTVFGDAGDEISRQFGLIFSTIGDTLKASAVQLGRDGDTVATAISQFVVDIPRLSLKDLKGDALQEAVSTAIGAQADTIARAVLPGLEAFQQIGEGYYETLIRVASGTETAAAQLDRLGITAVGLGDLVNKQGDVASEIVRQSIAGYETVGGSLTSVGRIISQIDGSAAELADTYRALVSVRGQLASVGAAGALDETLIRAAGGLDALSQSLGSYFDNFFSDSERTAAGFDRLAEQLHTLGIDTVPTTRAQFRALVQSFTPVDAASARTYAGLLALADGFAALVPEVEDTTTKIRSASDILSERQGLEVELLRLQGDTAALRQRELATLDPTNRALQEHIWALQDQQAAAATAATLAASWESASTRAADGVRSAFSVVQQQIDAERQRLKQESDAQISAARDLADENIRTLQQQADQIESTFGGLLESLKDNVQSLTDDLAGDGGRGGALGTLRNALADLRAGRSVDLDAVKQAASTASNIATTGYATELEYRRGIAGTASLLRDLSGAARSEQSRQLGAIAAQQVAIEQARDAQIRAIEQARDSQLGALDSQLAEARAQVSALVSIDEGVQGVAGALDRLGDAMSVLISLQGGGGTTGQLITAGGQQVYESGAGAVATRAVGSGIAGIMVKGKSGAIASGATLRDAIKQLVAADNWARIAEVARAEGIDSNMIDAIMDWAPGTTRAAISQRGLPAFAAGGYHHGGVRVVGEVAPEIAVTGPERIYSFDQLMQMAGSDQGALRAEMQALREQSKATADMVTALLTAIADHSSRTASNTDRIDRSLELVIDGSDSIATRAA